MLCSMRWVEEGVEMLVSELSENDTIGISVGDAEDTENEYYITLDKDNITRLRDWLNKALEKIKE